MKRQEIIQELRKYFKIQDLVCPHTLKSWTDKSWMFIDTEILHTLLVLRKEILKVPLVCNTKTLTQRGLRCNLCEINKDKTERDVLSLSAHSNGKGFDLSSPDMSAEQMRKKIMQHADLLPYPVRIEEDVNWLHIDCYDMGNPYKITFFKG